eukprot:Gb_19452 [translate_table: standard]
MQQFGGGLTTMYEDYLDPQHESNMPPDDQSNCSGIMCLEENLQRPLIRLPNFSLGELTQNNISDEAGIGSELQQQLNFELEQEYHSQMMQDVLQQHTNLHQEICSGQQPTATTSSWEASIHEMQEMTLFHQQQQQQQQQHLLQVQDPQHHMSSFTSAFTGNNTSNNSTAYPAPELLNLLQLPRCSVPSTTNISFGSKKHLHSLEMFPILNSEMGDHDSTLVYDPQISFPPQPPLLRDLFHSLPRNYQLPSKSYFGIDDKEAALQEAEGRQFTNSILDFKRDISLSKGEIRGTNHFATERQRREYLNEKYQTLRTLVPNPTKHAVASASFDVESFISCIVLMICGLFHYSIMTPCAVHSSTCLLMSFVADRASIVGDAIDYIKELLRTVEELKILVEQKRCGSGRSKRLRIDREGALADMESSSQQPLLQNGQDQKFLTNGSLRSSWLQRTSKDGTQVDVRIVDNEVNIKLIQRKRRNCLLCVSRILHELHLEILHANGANIGEHYIFMFNTKIYEGSCIYAGSIATKLIDAVDRPNPNSTYNSTSFQIHK